MNSKIGNLVFRVDASHTIGIGHVMRCLTLAEALARRGATVYFACVKCSGDMQDYIQDMGYGIVSLDYVEEIPNISYLMPYIDWLVVDHYGLDARWESSMRGLVKHIMVIDDLANRNHDCDLLLDQNFYLDMEVRYQGLVPAQCVKLLGPHYVLLRQEFFSVRENSRKRGSFIKNILVFFGGSDPTGETLKTLQVLLDLQCAEKGIEIHVVVGASNPKGKRIEEFCKQHENIYFYCQVRNMAELMVKADISIGAGGTATWERCLLGLPSLVIAVADNQVAVAEAVADKKAILYLGTSASITREQLGSAILEVLHHPQILENISANAVSLMGNGQYNGPQRVVFEMQNITNKRE